MARIVLVTDSSADVPPELANELGIVVVPASYGFADTTARDRDIPAADFFARMANEPKPPRPFGVSEPAFRAAFSELFGAGDEPFCVVSPFDVNPSFTIANAAMLSFDHPGMKVVNAGVASAGLCSLLVSLADGLAGGWDRTRLLEAIEELAPRCDSVFVPATAEWLGRAGRLALIEEKLGDVDDGHLVVRVGTRITGVAIEDDVGAALTRAVAIAGQRAGNAPVVVTIDHAAAPELAGEAARVAGAQLEVARLVITELSATFGSQLGPGAVGIGVAPAYQEGEHA